MRKPLFIFSLLAITNSAISFAQDNAQTQAIFTQYGNIKASTVITEEATKPPTATRKQFLANTELTARTTSSTCKVTEFHFRILPDNAQDFLTYQVTGSGLTPEIIKMVKELKTPGARVMIDGIKAKCDGKELTGTPLFLILENDKN